MKKLVGNLALLMILTFGLVVPSASASAASINDEVGTENVISNATYSKYIQIPWYPHMPTTYQYNDGMYSGKLYLVGAWWENPESGGPANGGWLAGTVYCSKNCTLPSWVAEEE